MRIEENDSKPISMRLDILDYSVYGNEADRESDALLKAASEALGYRTRVIPLTRGTTISKPEKRVWLRYDLRSRDDLVWITHVAENLERNGHRVFPRASSIVLSEDKWEAHLALKAAGVQTVETYDLHRALPRGTRVILKPRVGWGGAGITLIDSMEGSLPILPRGPEDYIWQPFIPHRQTWTVALGGESPIAILEKRSAGNDFRTNADFGEQATEAGDPGGATTLSAHALRAVGLIAGTVDIIRADGQLAVLEVNSAPCLWYDNCPALDLAGPMIRSVMEWMDRYNENSPLHTQ